MCVLFFKDIFNPIIEFVSILGVHTYFRHLVLSVIVYNYPTLSLDKVFVKYYIELGIQGTESYKVKPPVVLSGLMAMHDLALEPWSSCGRLQYLVTAGPGVK